MTKQHRIAAGEKLIRSDGAEVQLVADAVAVVIKPARSLDMGPESIEEIVARLERVVESMDSDTRPALVRLCLLDVTRALQILAAGNPSGVLESTEE